MSTLFSINDCIAHGEKPGMNYGKRIAGGEIVRALWWKQPFASMMLHGKIETRSRDTKVRGLVLICSTIRPYDGFDLAVMCEAGQIRGINDKLKGTSQLNGTALAIGELANSYQMKQEHEEAAYVRYDPSRWCWQFTNVRPIEPFTLPGKQGWSIIDEQTRNKIRFK